ncbi:dihydroxyacetone kinase subunit DhaK [Enterococcus sp. ALS3]|uniref:Dihydroxyacetone kinase subunit DhaK n=1 Tax=Enterococcus alishanensis TaxID=1303817 RepID=A0ABS6THJ3_9ENTE|nr:dihydroxyacetone kinase subunit DhaK [Enterococcus alishanensis]
MKKIINTTETLIEDMLAGFLAAEKGQIIQSDNNPRVLYKKNKTPGKVGVVVGGGSGHEPLFFGLIGENFADSVAVGNIFTAPTPDTVLEAIKEADQGAGVICLFGNYAGDVLNFEVAAELAELEEIEVCNLPIIDDVASATYEKRTERRGIAGDLFVIKEVAAAASQGFSLERCHQLGQLANKRTLSIGVGIAPGTNPMNGKANFELAEDEIEFGLGIHGEPGLERMKLLPARELVEKMFVALEGELATYPEKEVIVCVNGLGSTTMMELYIINNEIQQLLSQKGLKTVDTVIGNICTTQEMAGFSITIQSLNQELAELYQVAADSPCFFKREVKQ